MNQPEIPKVFVISLNSCSERRIHIQQQFDQMGIEFEFADAVDGRKLSQHQQAQLADSNTVRQCCDHDLSPGEIGCALSHIALYQRMADEEIERAIILEDDCFIDQTFPDVLRDIEVKAPERAELIFLFHGKAKTYPIKRQLGHGYKLARYRYPSKNSHRKIISTVGYLLTLSGAQKLLTHAYPVRMPSDYLTGTIQLTRINSYGVEPCCIDHDEGVFNTTITGRNYGPHVQKRTSQSKEQIGG